MSRIPPETAKIIQGKLSLDVSEFEITQHSKPFLLYQCSDPYHFSHRILISVKEVIPSIIFAFHQKMKHFANKMTAFKWQIFFDMKSC